MEFQSNIRSIASYSQESFWLNCVRIQSLYSSNWWLRSTAIAESLLPWHVRKNTILLLQFDWDARSSIANAANSFWNQYQQSTGKSNPKWSLRENITGSTDFIWIDLEIISCAENFVWDICLPISDSQNLYWALRANANRCLRSQWDRSASALHPTAKLSAVGQKAGINPVNTFVTIVEKGVGDANHCN